MNIPLYPSLWSSELFETQGCTWGFAPFQSPLLNVVEKRLILAGPLPIQTGAETCAASLGDLSPATRCAAHMYPMAGRRAGRGCLGPGCGPDRHRAAQWSLGWTLKFQPPAPRAPSRSPGSSSHPALLLPGSLSIYFSLSPPLPIFSDTWLQKCPS